MGDNFKLDHLSHSNARTIEHLFGADFIDKSMRDTLSSEDVIQANHMLAKYLYGLEIASLLRNRNIKTLNALHEAALEQVAVDMLLLKKVDLDSLGIVVVRPEIIHITHECIDFLNRSGLFITYSRPLQVNFTQYWSLYHHGLIDPESYSDFPTRTLNYINKPCYLIIVTRNEGMESGLSVSDTLIRDFKGREGSFSASTLRGDIVFRALDRFVQDDNQSFISEANIALDPIGAYRKLVRGDISSDLAHRSADSPLLFYAGQGVHIPNNNEISRDLRILCTQQEIERMLTNGLLPLNKTLTRQDSGV